MTLLDTDPGRTRLVSVVAATLIALACGTNYIYSAWAPQFAQRLKLSSTESNLIGTIANLGMYAAGIPFGMMVDAKTPRWGVALGIVLFGVGYYPIAKAYDAGPGVYSVAALCLFSFFTGAGSSAAFTAAIKASALNYPESRGTATAFPLAAFGLSALFFSGLALLLPHSTSNFLLLLATGTVILPIVSFPFLRVVPTHTYQHLPQQERQALRRRSSDPVPIHVPDETGAQKPHTAPAPLVESSTTENDEEHSSLLSTSSGGEQDLESSKHTGSDKNHESPHLDIRGLALLSLPEFWNLFCVFCLLTGIGLMTINNIGNNAQALWLHYDDKVDPHFVEGRQVMHVSILSFFSFAGRLLSGIGSDILVSKLNRSRMWCLFVSAIIFSAAQLVTTVIENPNFLFLVSSLTGLAYGILFGVSPSLVAHAFGVNGLSQNWGTMTLAPAISGNVFNLLYGRIYDSHSVVEETGDRACHLGRGCYSAAYWVTFAASIGGVVLCLWTIWHEDQTHKKRESSHRRTNHDRVS